MLINDEFDTLIVRSIVDEIVFINKYYWRVLWIISYGKVINGFNVVDFFFFNFFI